jgi:hypothetical protein
MVHVITGLWFEQSYRGCSCEQYCAPRSNSHVRPLIARFETLEHGKRSQDRKKVDVKKQIHACQRMVGIQRDPAV